MAAMAFLPEFAPSLVDYATLDPEIRATFYDPAEWRIVSEPVAYSANGYPAILSAHRSAFHVEILQAPEQILTSWKKFPDEIKVKIWEASLSDPRIIRLHERVPVAAHAGVPASQTPPIMGPIPFFYTGNRLQFEENLHALDSMGEQAFFNKYTRMDLYIPPPTGTLGVPNSILVDRNRDTLLINIKVGSPPEYLSHLDLSNIRHLAIGTRTRMQLTRSQQAIAVWDLARMFPVLKTLTVIIGAASWNRKPPNSEFKLVEIDESFLAVEPTLARYSVGPAIDPRELRYWKNVADLYKSDALRLENVDLKVAMVAWFSGTSITEREPKIVHLQPVKPRYHGVAYYTKMRKSPIDIDKTVGAKSRHILTFEQMPLVVKARPDGGLFTTSTDFLEDIRRLPYPDTEEGK